MSSSTAIPPPQTNLPRYTTIECSAMDSIYAIGMGLGIRALIDSIAHDNHRASALVGLWEGIVLNHFVVKLPTSFDPYLAFGFRLFVDFLFTESLTRMTIIVLWTGLGMLFADIGGEVFADRRFRRFSRRIRRKLPLPSFEDLPYVQFSRVRFLEGSETASESSRTTLRSTTLPPQSPLQPILRRSTRPLPGQFDQWSEVTTQLSNGSQVSTDTRDDRNRDEEDDPERTPRPSPTVLSEALSYVDEVPITDIPLIPDNMSQARLSLAPQDDELVRLGYGSSGLTTPAHPLSPNTHPEDQPYIHSGLTTPRRPVTPYQDPNLPPVQTYSESRPLSPLTDVPPIPIPLSARITTHLLEGGAEYMGGFTIPQPFMDTNGPQEYTNPLPTTPGFIIPSDSQIPDIPGEEASYMSKREEARATAGDGFPDAASMADPPPSYQEPIVLRPPPSVIPETVEPPEQASEQAAAEPSAAQPAPVERNFPDHVSEAGESVISGHSRTAIIGRAESFRQEAQAMEKERDKIRSDLRKAQQDKRWLDALKLEVDLEEAQERAKQLHAKAAHRFWRGM